MSHLTPAQQATLKADINANTNTIPAGQTWTGAFQGLQIQNVPNNGDGNTAVYGWYNVQATPIWTVWKKSPVTIGEIGKAFVSSELAGLSSLNNGRLQTLSMYLAGGVDGSLSTNRAFFDDVFSGAGGTATRAALLILWKRLASRAEKLFSTGTGSDASPAVPGIIEGPLQLSDIEQARNS